MGAAHLRRAAASANSSESAVSPAAAARSAMMHKWMTRLLSAITAPSNSSRSNSARTRSKSDSSVSIAAPTNRTTSSAWPSREACPAAISSRRPRSVGSMLSSAARSRALMAAEMSPRLTLFDAVASRSAATVASCAAAPSARCQARRCELRVMTAPSARWAAWRRLTDSACAMAALTSGWANCTRVSSTVNSPVARNASRSPMSRRCPDSSSVADRISGDLGSSATAATSAASRQSFARSCRPAAKARSSRWVKNHPGAVGSTPSTSATAAVLASSSRASGLPTA